LPRFLWYSGRRLKVDGKLLDELQKVFMSTPQFGDKFWRESKRLADERGPEIIHAIMVHGRTWQGEEGLIFVPLVALLPRAPTLKLLKQYEQSKRESKRLADERGPEIIHAIMVHGRTWQGEEGLIFVPLVALLPRAPTLKLLKQYEQSKRESDRIWAREFQTEFEASDTQDGVRKYSKPK
jgi:hypothetical protein